MDSLIRELKFALRDRVVFIGLIGIALLSSYSLIMGLNESDSERALIERTQKLVAQDREYTLAKQSDAGGAAYYAFHFTYSSPSALAFISRGVRDDLPWKHRIRMLALEGQIYETDTANPELSKVGKLDFSFVAALLLPLLSILFLYDLRAVELRNNRWAFLSATSGSGNRLLMVRAALRTVLLYLAVLLPFLIAVVIGGVAAKDTLLVIAAIALNSLFWCVMAYFTFTRIASGPTTAAVLLGLWFAIAVAIPVGGKHLTEKHNLVPNGGEILLTQRETVNDAWDLPKANTMTPFLERHPEWNNTPDVTQPFEWRWYYAFQQVGDQSVESMSKALRAGIAKRDAVMSMISLASPTLLTQRLLASAANTDTQAFLRYDDCVRQFHRSLREFHYPMLFGDAVFSDERMKELPIFRECSR